MSDSQEPNQARKETQSLSVIIPTFNRAESLRRTLRGFLQLDTSGLNVEFIVVDNNSTDGTRAVLKEFGRRLPLKVLGEAQQGKNYALNRALYDSQLGEIVVFTDDDVDVGEEWLQNVVSISNRWPQYSIFGGSIELLWPDMELPGWTKDKFVRSFGYTEHFYADFETEYTEPHTPFGPNYWVRGSLLKSRKFNVAIGPHPSNRVLGDEVQFILDFVKDGFVPFYSPESVVKHRIDSNAVSKDWIFARAHQLGRGVTHRGLPKPDQLDRSKAIWEMQRRISYSYHIVCFWLIANTSGSDDAILKAINHRRDAAINLEALAIGLKS